MNVESQRGFDVPFWPSQFSFPWPFPYTSDPTSARRAFKSTRRTKEWAVVQFAGETGLTVVKDVRRESSNYREAINVDYQLKLKHTW